MTNTPISASTEQKPASDPQQTQGNPQQGNQQQNQGGNKPSTDKPAGQPQQK
jgi:hypothetical protein